MIIKSKKMKKVGRLKDKFLNKETIEEAIHHLCRGEKRNKWTKSMSRRWDKILSNKEAVIDKLLCELDSQTYVFSDFNIFLRQEGKKVRKIYASEPLDQIVDYILDKCLKYVFMEEKKIIHKNCYGSIKGKGQHELRKKIIKRIKGHENIYVANCDTKQYYPSINQKILYNFIEQHIKCKWCLWLCKAMVTRIPGGKGIALGTATSNILGHIYHAALDWTYILEHGLGGYYRFCDDKLIIHTDKNLLHSEVRCIKEDIQESLDQVVKDSWRVVGFSGGQCVEFLGALISSKGARLSTSSRRRIERHFHREQKLPFNVGKDNERVIRTWAGIKGSLKDIHCKGLIKYWAKESRYKDFFNRLRMALEWKELKRKGYKNPVVYEVLPECFANPNYYHGEKSIGFHYDPLTNKYKRV